MGQHTGSGARRGQAGFTFVELLVTIAIVGALSAVGLPMYLGYTKEARMAEGKSLAGSAHTAATACALIKNQMNTMGICELADVARHVGVGSSTGVTGDGRWTVTVTPVMGNIPGPSFFGTIGVVGVSGRDTDGIGVGMHVAATGVALRCQLVTNTVPAITQGDPC